eukprot:GHVU01147973.1.p1 GENE.GHVU01147973.1~~GHVU01147973.1.p1  ORF type:complete len:172 (+),score=14.58 GHVU01147973.1:58-573(+)
MRWFNQEHIYKHDWETVTTAFWQKYPNSFQPHVARIDTVNRNLDPENQRFRVKRILSLHYNVPGWVTRLFRCRATGLAEEETTCNLKEKTLHLRSRNYTFSNLLLVEEHCTYRVDPNNSNQTLYTASASYTVAGIGYIRNALEGWAIKTAEDKAAKGLAAMTDLINRLEQK